MMLYALAIVRVIETMNIRMTIQLLFLIMVPGVLSAHEGDRSVPDTALELEMQLDAQFLDRMMVIAIKLAMDEETAGKFWPVYESYQGEIREEREGLIILFEEYATGPYSDGEVQASIILELYFNAKAETLRIKRAYMPLFVSVLSSRQVVLLMQLENRLDARFDLHLARSIPLIE
jgi:hypothetical protein